MRSHLPALSVSCAAAAAWFASQSATLPSTADCDASPPVPKVVPAKAPRATAVSVAEFRRWLQQRGATLDGLDIRRAADPSDPTASLAVYANDEAHRRTTRGVWGSTKRLVGLDRGEVPLATFPIASTLTASSIARLPHQGPLIAEVLEAGALDERTAVVLHLAVERARGAESLLRPWLALLPSAFATPLFWSEEELAWLKGTTLFKAAM